MRRILIPVDGTKNSEAAVRHVLGRFMADTAIEIHLLSVRAPLPLHATRFATRKQVAGWHREASAAALVPARELLDQHRVPYVTHTGVGAPAEAIASAARRLRCAQIVMGEARRSPLSRLLQGSFANRLLDLTDVPVELVAGQTASPLERVGVPAGIGAAIALIAMASD